MGDMRFSPEALAKLAETSRQMAVREAEIKAEMEAKAEAAYAQRQAEYEAMTLLIAISTRSTRTVPSS